jgi:O-antigen/teichoic acid export membrane protein
MKIHESAYRILSNSGYIAAQLLFNGVLQFVFFAYLTYALGVDYLSIFELGRNYLEIGTGIIAPGLVLIIIRENSRQKDWWIKHRSPIIRLNTFAALLVALISFILGNLYTFETQRVLAIAIFCITIYFHSICNLYEALFLSIEKVHITAKVSILCNIISIGIGVAGIYLTPYKLFSASFSILIRWILSNYLLDRQLRKEYSTIKLSSTNSSFDLAQIFRMYWPLTLGSISFSIYAKIDVLMLEWFGYTSEIAIYSGAYRITMLLCGIFLSIYQVISPKISRNLKISLLKTYRLVFIIGIIIGTFGLCLSFLIQIYGNLILLIYDNAFEHSEACLRILSWTIPIIFFGNAFGFYLINEEKDGVYYYAGISVFGMAFNIIGNYIFIPQYNILGAAAMTVATDGVTTLAMVVFSGIIALKSLNTEYPLE